MANVIKSVGHGLCAAAVVLLAIYFLAAYLRGPDALYEAINPLAAKTYLVLLAMVPGTVCIWLGHYLSARRRRSINPSGTT
jgi:hypothetical protein